MLAFGQVMGAAMEPYDQHYAFHLATLQRRCRDLLGAASSQLLVFHAGHSLHQLLADQPLPFRANPFFLQWNSALSLENAWLLTDGSHQPKLIIPSELVDSCWSNHHWWNQFEIVLLDHSHQIERWLPSVDDAIYIGPHPEVAKALDFKAINPEEVINYFYQQRAVKTDFEQYCLRQAGKLASRAMGAVRDLFYQEGTPLDLYLGYLKSLGCSELMIPPQLTFNQQVGKTPVLPFALARERLGDTPCRSLAFVASCQWHRYQVQIGRSWAFRRDLYAEFLASFDAVFADLAEQIRLGQRYDEIGQQLRLKLAGLLVDWELLHCSVRQCLQLNVLDHLLTAPFIHFIGLGLDEPLSYPVSPLGVETIQSGHAFSLNVSLSFDPQFLSRYANAQNDLINWDKLDMLHQYGGAVHVDSFLAGDATVECLTA